MEKDLTVLLAERDILKHKLELEKLRDENIRLMQQIDERIDSVKSEITDAAITKTMSVLDNTRAWLQYGSALFIVFITAAGFIGYNSLNKELTAYYKDTVRHWLRFEDNNSEGSKALDELRTNALLDSLTLRFEREKKHSNLATVTLNSFEKHRLMSLVLDPTSDDSQFRDALRLITHSRGLFGWSSEDDEAKRIADIVVNPKFSNSKRLQVLYAMGNEHSLLPWALNILDNTSIYNDENIVMHAFNNVRIFNQERARLFAEENINRFHQEHNRIKLAEYLIEIGADNNSIDSLINELKSKESDFSAMNFQTLIFARVVRGWAENNNNTLSSARYISDQIDNGMKMVLSDFLAGDSIYALSIDGYTSAMPGVERFIGNKELINAIVKEKALTVERLLKLSQFFQVQDRGLWLTVLMMKPGSETEFTFNDYPKIKGDSVLDYIWLRAEYRMGKSELIMSWRDKGGKFKEAVLSNVSKGEQAHYHVDFNKEQLKKYSWNKNFSDYNIF